MAAVNDLVTRFSFVGSLKPQENFNKNLTASIGLVVGVSTAIVGATTAFIAWNNSVTQAIDPMVQLSRETDVAVGTIQELGYAASQNGSDVDAVMSSIKELTKRSGEFARTGGGTAAEAFLQLGVSVRDANGQMKTADKLIMDVSRSMQSYSKSEQADLLDKLGIDPSMIQLMNQSGEAIDSLRAKAQALGTITKEQADAAASLNDSNTTLKFGLQGLQNQIATGMAPVIQGITEDFIEFLVANKDLITNGIKSLGKWLVAATGFIKRMTPVVLGVAAAFGVWQVANMGVAATLGLIFSPVLLIAAGIALVALVVDDLIVAFNGGNSVIAEFISQWLGFDIVPILKIAATGVIEFAKTAFSAIVAVKDLIFGVFSGIGDIWNGDFSKGFDKITGSLFEFIDLMKDSFLESFNFIADQFAALMPEFVSDLFADTVEETAGFRGGNNGAVNNGVTNNQNQTANINQNNNYSIYSSDPVAAGQQVYSYQNKANRETKQYYNRGGM